MPGEELLLTVKTTAELTKREMAKRFREACRKATAEEKADPDESESELKNTDSESESASEIRRVRLCDFPPFTDSMIVFEL